jgi:hypothetical protein
MGKSSATLKVQWPSDMHVSEVKLARRKCHDSTPRDSRRDENFKKTLPPFPIVYELKKKVDGLGIEPVDIVNIERTPS